MELSEKTLLLVVLCVSIQDFVPNSAVSFYLSKAVFLNMLDFFSKNKFSLFITYCLIERHTYMLSKGECTHAACPASSLPVNIADASGWTPLHVAACNGRQAVAAVTLRQTSERLCQLLGCEILSTSLAM